jgi:hypothetical protein
MYTSAPIVFAVYRCKFMSFYSKSSGTETKQNKTKQDKRKQKMTVLFDPCSANQSPCSCFPCQSRDKVTFFRFAGVNCVFARDVPIRELALLMSLWHYHGHHMSTSIPFHPGRLYTRRFIGYTYVCVSEFSSALGLQDAEQQSASHVVAFLLFKATLAFNF